MRQEDGAGVGRSPKQLREERVIRPIDSGNKSARAMGKGDDMQARSEIQFKVGDKAVYPAQGVAEVVNIEEKDIAGNRQRFYVLRILDTDRKIMVPVSNASAVGLPTLATRVSVNPGATAVALVGTAPPTVATARAVATSANEGRMRRTGGSVIDLCSTGANGKPNDRSGWPQGRCGTGAGAKASLSTRST